MILENGDVWDDVEFQATRLGYGNQSNLCGMILLVEEILHQLICSLSHYLLRFYKSQVVGLGISSEPSTVWNSKQPLGNPFGSRFTIQSIHQISKASIGSLSCRCWSFTPGGLLVNIPFRLEGENLEDHPSYPLVCYLFRGGG